MPHGDLAGTRSEREGSGEEFFQGTRIAWLGSRRDTDTQASWFKEGKPSRS